MSRACDCFQCRASGFGNVSVCSKCHWTYVLCIILNYTLQSCIVYIDCIAATDTLLINHVCGFYENDILLLKDTDIRIIHAWMYANKATVVLCEVSN